MDNKERLTVAEAGRRGGHATLANQGVDFFRKIGKKGGRRTAELYAHLLAEFGRKGGRPRRPSLAEQPGENTQKKRRQVGPWAVLPPVKVYHRKLG